MFKLNIAVITLCLTLAACGTKSRNQVADSPAEDDSDLGSSTKVISQIADTDVPNIGKVAVAGCETKTSEKNQIVNPEIKVGSTFTEVKNETSNGLKAKYTDVYTVTAVSPTQIDLDVVNKLNKGTPVSSKLICQVSAEDAPELACGAPGSEEKHRFQEKKPEAKLNPQNRGDCTFDADIKPDSQTGDVVQYPLKAGGPMISGKAIVIDSHGTITCDGKAIEGKKHEVKIYADSFPSFRDTGCGLAVVRKLTEYRDTKNNLIQRKVKKLTDSTLTNPGN